MKKITVVMPTYREPKKQVCQAIESILNQTCKDFYYIIILDDPENKELQALIQEYANKDERISFFVNEENYGCPYSKDKGIRLADTEYIAIMDADDIARANRLEMQLAKIEREQLDLVASYVRVVDEDETPLYNMDQLPLVRNKIEKKIKVNNCMPHPTWFIKRSMYIALGGYANMQGCEDYDFLIRAIKAGYKLGMVGEILLDYRLSTHSVSRNNLYRQYLMMKYIQDKYYKKHQRYESYEQYERKRYTENRASHYAKAAVLFEKGMLAKSQHKYLYMFYYFIKSFINSKDYATKIFRYVLQELA